jgi:hypothetical protein
MQRAFQWLAVFAVVCFAAGCGNSAESLLKQQIADMNAMADAIEANKSEAEITAIKDRMEANGKKMDKMDVSEAEKNRLKEKYAPEMEKAGKRMFSAMMKGAGGGLDNLLKGPMPPLGAPE